ncbi:MAG: YfbK domain-containing protein [Planctomycetota bacterium]|jgi:Ca-activated chloride channel family protein
MSIKSNDPRLTAYALGEMDEKERLDFEQELDAAGRAEVDAIRALAGDLGAELTNEPVPALSAEQRASVTRGLQPRRWTWGVAAMLFVTASVAAVWGWNSAPVELHDARVAKAEKRKEAWESLPGSAPPKPVKAPDVYLEPAQLRIDQKVTAVRVQPDQVLDELRESVRSQTAKIDELATVVNGASPPATSSASPLFFTSRREGWTLVEQPRNRNAYDRIVENTFRRTSDEHTSTFSIDVDTASYSQVRRYLASGQRPPKDAVRIEELINYFSYDYAPPADGAFATHVELAACPWNGRHLLARIALKGREIARAKRPQSNLVFLVDVSGSMQSHDKLELLKRGLELLITQLDERDRVSIVVYAGAAGCVLGPTNGANKKVIRGVLGSLEAGGSTNGGQGIQLAYELARKNFVKGGTNRVLLCTDGDFNVGMTDRGSLTRLIEKEAKSGVFLSVLGFGTGNYQDAAMEDLSNRGNGNYAYIDSLREAQKVLVEQMSGTLVTIAKDVKIQIFFNPSKVEGWRLIGYENRVLAAKDFNDDKKDAGDIGAGHTVTALYELVPAGSSIPGAEVDPNPFVERKVVGNDRSLFRLRLRFKRPDSDKSTLIERDITERGAGFDKASPEFRWASGVAAFGMLLRGSDYIEGANLGAVEEICAGAIGEDSGGYRAEFLKLVQRARKLR